MLAEAKAYAETESVSYSCKVRTGNPTVEISSEGRETGIRCIVMGYRGSGADNSSKTLGSVSGAILQLSPCPVTLVPQQG